MHACMQTNQKIYKRNEICNKPFDKLDDTHTIIFTD